MLGLMVSISVFGSGSVLSYQLTVIFQNICSFLVKVILPCQDTELGQISSARIEDYQDEARNGAKESQTCELAEGSGLLRN